jgi:hypothetical protein
MVEMFKKMTYTCFGDIKGDDEDCSFNRVVDRENMLFPLIPTLLTYPSKYFDPFYVYYRSQDRMSKNYGFTVGPFHPKHSFDKILFSRQPKYLESQTNSLVLNKVKSIEVFKKSMRQEEQYQIEILQLISDKSKTDYLNHNIHSFSVD